jgi:hypothetical protein
MDTLKNAMVMASSLGGSATQERPRVGAMEPQLASLKSDA